LRIQTTESISPLAELPVEIAAGGVTRAGDLSLPLHRRGVVLLDHTGSGPAADRAVTRKGLIAPRPNEIR
jgi:hypothetical protein